jgi:hypothetical protein
MDKNFITIKYENANRRFEYNKDTMVFTMTDTYYVNKDDIPEIIENINKLNDYDNK